ncbi:MAG: peptidoglycan-associated lipoprotein Pal [Candidatus Zixiibacteriota bacterium]
MKRLGMLGFVGLLSLLLLIASCGKKKEEIVEQPIVTAPVVEDTTSVEPIIEEPPPPELKESQFETVYFDFDKYNLRDDGRKNLDHNYNLMKEFPDVMVKIEGHCDERGTVEYNLSLGEKRANSTKDYLVNLGISPDRVSTISYGKERPADNGHSEAAWAKNRRAEFRITSQ